MTEATGEIYSQFMGFITEINAASTTYTFVYFDWKKRAPKCREMIVPFKAFIALTLIYQGRHIC